MHATFADVRRVAVSALDPQRNAECCSVISSFIEGESGDDPGGRAEDLSEVMGVVGAAKRPTRLLLLRAVKHVSRREGNQKTVARGTITTLSKTLATTLREADVESSYESLASLSNFAHNNSIVTLLRDALKLTPRCLLIPTLTEVTCNFIQSACMHMEAKREAVDIGLVQLLLGYLPCAGTDAMPERTLAVVNALHNVATHITAAQYFILESEGTGMTGVEAVTSLLSHPVKEVRRTAAGLVQSLSRSPDCLEGLAHHDATLPLTGLLSDPDLATQLSSIQALLNINGSNLEATESREMFKSVMACIIASSALRDSYCPQP